MAVELSYFRVIFLPLTATMEPLVRATDTNVGQRLEFFFLGGGGNSVIPLQSTYFDSIQLLALLIIL
jgi:hypothetical protein